jgi:predicted ArsR family transcriptional regulator
VLTAVLDVLVDQLPAERAAAVLHETGRRRAASAGGEARGTLEERMRAAAAVLAALGGEVELVLEDDVLRLRGWGCPLSASVARRPELCGAVETLVSEIVGAPVRQCCEHGERPRCGFAAPTAA